MTQSVEQVIRQSKNALRQVRRSHNSPAKARRYLLEIGLLEKHTPSKHGVRLAKPYRAN